MRSNAPLFYLSSSCFAKGAPLPTGSSVSVVALNEAGKIRVTWSRPTLGSSQVITGYSVQYRRRGTTSYTTHSVSGSSTTSYTITNLNLGTVYEVRVASVGPLGLSGYCCGSGKQVTTYSSECMVWMKGYIHHICKHYMTSVVPIGYCCLLLCSVPTMYFVLTIQNANLAMYIHHMPPLVLLNFAEFHIHLQ